MGAANCCKRPDEIVIDEVKYASTDNNKMIQVDKESYPQDTEQVHKSNANAEEEYAQGQTVSNHNLYEQEMGSPKIGGVYEVPINVSNPQQNYEEGNEQHNMGSIQQYENQNMQQNAEDKNLNQYEQEQEQEEQEQYEENENENINNKLNKQMSGEGNDYEGENQEDYNTLVNKMGNEANLKALRMGNQGLNKIIPESSGNYTIQQSQKINYNNSQNNIENSQGINLNAIGLNQQGGVNLKNLTLGSQQTGQNLSQNVRQVGYNTISKSQQQTTSNSINNNQMVNMNNFGVVQKDNQTNSQISDNEDLNKYFQQASSRIVSINSQQQIVNENLENNSRVKSGPVDLKQLAFSANPQAYGGLDLNKILQQKNINTHTVQKSEGVASVTPISTNEDISKYFKQQSNKVSMQQKNSPNDLSDDSSVKAKVTKINIDMEDLPETFGSSDINNYKKTTTTTTVIKKEGSPDFKDFKIDMKNFNLDMKDLPETFGSSDINKTTKTVTTKTVEKEGDKIKETTTTTKTTGNVDLGDFKIDMKKYIEMKDLPETFGSSNINNYKQTTTTTTTIQKEGNPDLKDFKIDMKNFNLDMKDLPETFGSSDINKTTKTVTTTTIEKDGDKVKETTTTTKTSGNVDLSNFKFDMKKFNLDMNDLPETFGSSDINKNVKQTTTTTTTTIKKEGNSDNPNINNLKETTTTTTTKTIGNADLGDFKIDMKNFNIDMKDLPETFGSSDINKNVKQTTTTTTTTINKKGNIEPKDFNIDMKNYKLDMDDLPEVFGSSNINQNYKGVTTTTKTVQKEGKDIDIKDLPEGLNPLDVNNFKQITTTTTTEGKLDNKEFQGSFGPSDVNNFKQTTTTITTEGKMGPNDLSNFKETKTTTTTVKNEGNFDMKDFKFDMNKFNLDMKDLPSAFGSSDISNYKQVTTTTKTMTTGNAPVDLNKLGLEHKHSSMQEISNDSNNVQQTTTTTTTKITGNGPLDLKGLGMEQNQSTNINENEEFSKYFQQTSQTTSEPINLQRFGFEGNPSNSNMKQTTTTTITKTTGNSPMDIKEFGIQHNQNGNNGIDLKRVGNEDSSPIIGNEDFNKYFQETKTTTIKTNEPIDLKEFQMNANSASSNGGIDLNSLGFDGSSRQQNTSTTITKTTKIENTGGDIDLNNFGNNSRQFAAKHESFGNIQNNDFNTYGTSKTTITKSTQSFAGPTQSYSYNYSFNMPDTTSATVTKTTYSEVAP